jgi:threonine dehydratase
VVVSDDEVRTAMRYAFNVLKLVIEPGGAVALAAILSRMVDITGKNVAIIVSGGNVDADMFADIISKKG